MYAVNRIPNKRRHRSTVRNGHIATYTDSRTAADEQAVRDAYKGECFDCAVRVVVHTFKALPKSRPKRIERERDTTKPDIDNVLKAVLDALNGAAYRDDSQVVEVRVVKHDRTRKHGDSIRFEVEPIPENELV